MKIPQFLVVASLVVIATAASAQVGPACQRLEAQLTALDRGNDDPGRAETVRRAEDATNRQQIEVDRLVVQGRRTGCESSGFFSIFSSPPPQCGPLNAQIQRARDTLERMQTQLERLHGGNTERAAQRRSLMMALGDNNCGPQYRSAALQQGGGGFLDQLFGGRTIMTPAGDQQAGSNFRTICVRTCDGYYFPISFSVSSARFAEDAQTCQRMCPAAQVSLYAYHNPGEEIAQAVSVDGRPYTELPTAFAYRREFNPACSCRKAGQSWADAMKAGGDQTVEQGDIVVTEDRAKKLSQPRDAAGRPLKPALNPGPGTKNNLVDAPSTAVEPPNGKVRAVGPTFYPVR
jgi:hypothetical protein